MEMNEKQEVEYLFKDRGQMIGHFLETFERVNDDSKNEEKEIVRKLGLHDYYSYMFSDSETESIFGSFEVFETYRNNIILHNRLNLISLFIEQYKKFIDAMNIIYFARSNTRHISKDRLPELQLYPDSPHVREATDNKYMLHIALEMLEEIIAEQRGE